MFEVDEFVGGEGLTDAEVEVDDLGKVEREGEFAVEEDVDAVLVADARFEVGDLVFRRF